MWKALSAFAGLALLAGALSLLPGISPQVEASTPPPVVKSDRADPAECSRQAWPYYDSACLRDPARNAGRAPRIRIVTTDRLPGVFAPAPRNDQPLAWLASIPGHMPARIGTIYLASAQ